jgi:hypothetical protein
MVDKKMVKVGILAGYRAVKVFCLQKVLQNGIQG